VLLIDCAINRLHLEVVAVCVRREARREVPLVVRDRLHASGWDPTDI
jgi:hypothetical protein